MFQFRLLRGRHATGQRDSEGTPILLKPGDIVETDRNLIELFGAEKFQLVEGRVRRGTYTQVDSPVEAPEEPGLDKELKALTVKELREYAEAEEIDLAGATRKPEIVQVILQATNSKN